MVYVLDPERRERLLPGIEHRLLDEPGVGLSARLVSDGEASVRSRGGELRFGPGGDLADLRGRRWSFEGDASVLELDTTDGRVRSAEFPNALERLWQALTCPRSGDLLLSAAPGHEFVDWGGVDHVGGGSHGSLHRDDSEGVLLFAGTGPDSADAREQWTIEDATPLALAHFGVRS
jgi:hypothetical protein